MAMRRIRSATIVMFLACSMGARAIEFTSNTTISSSAYAGEDIIVTGCNLTIDCSGGPANYASILVRNVGMITHPAQGTNGLWINVAGDVEITQGSSISANARGYPAQTGPGAGYSGRGGSHGGVGGYAGAPVHDSLTDPYDFGSGGGNTGSTGGTGGGRIRLSIGGTLTVNGGLTADGAVTCSGGGAGGSIRVDAGAIAGGGRVSAVGSSCTSAIGTHGGGGGGRIALYYDTWSFTGAVSAAGGPGTWSLNPYNGGAGTVYRKPTAAVGSLAFDNGSVDAWTTHPAPSVPEAVLTVRSTGVKFDCSSGPVLAAGVLLAGSAAVRCPTGPAAGLHVEVSGDITVESGASFDVTGEGYPQESGPGAGASGAGGSHGGRGGAGGSDPYGRVGLPDTLGSGGGFTAGGPGASGGGALRLVAQGVLRIDGSVRADGAATTYGGGGAGGSIRLAALSIIGSGVVSASGGAGGSGGYNPGGGGGGRIAIAVPPGQASFPSGIVSVAGGSGSGGPGESGTVWRGDTDPLPDAAFIAEECGVEQQPDGSWRVGLTAVNVGLAGAAPLRIEAFDGDPALPGTSSLGHVVVPTVGAWCAQSVEIVTPPASPANIWAVLDPNNAIVEAHEDNNHIVFRVGKVQTTLYVPDRTGTISGDVILRAYLRVNPSGEGIPGKIIGFMVDGSAVGTGLTGSTGRADLIWTIPDGPATRELAARFDGDDDFGPSEASATLTCETQATKMSGVNREGKITAYRIFKAWLWKMDSAPVAGKTITFKLDGTVLGSDVTRAAGYAQIGYTIADGAGAGVRTILAEWAGDGGFLPSSCTNTLTVLKATPYIWVMPRSVPQGGVARLYAYFRRLADYRKQEGKTVTFRVDGTWIADVVTGSGADAGIARYSYITTEPPGAHTIRCEFAGDAWVDVGYGEATLTIY